MATKKRVTRSEDAAPQLLQFKAACAYGGFGRSTAYELLKQHKILAKKMGRRTMIIRSSIDAYHRSLPSAEPTNKEER